MATKIKSEVLIARFGNTILDLGFTSMPNAILFYKNRLKINAKEYLLISGVLAFTGRGLNEIHDKYLNPDGKSFIRQRKSLIEKGLLTCKVVKTIKNGKPFTAGIVYDFSGLLKKVEEIIEYDKSVQDSEAPVETVEYQLVLPGFEEFDEKPTEIPTTKKYEMRTEIIPQEIVKVEENTDEEDDFIKEFEALHFEVLRENIDLKARVRYKEYLTNAFRKRNSEYKKAFVKAKEMLMALEFAKRTSFKLQDFVIKALYMRSEDFVVSVLDDAYKIPSGMEKVKALFQALTDGINIEEAYKNACKT